MTKHTVEYGGPWSGYPSPGWYRHDFNEAENVSTWTGPYDTREAAEGGRL